MHIIQFILLIISTLSLFLGIWIVLGFGMALIILGALCLFFLMNITEIKNE